MTMNSDNTRAHDAAGPEPTREDVLIGRVTDHEASPADWDELERLASADVGVWARLAQAQRAHARLEQALDDEVAIAEFVSIDDAEPPAPIRLADRARWWAGWAAAAAVAVVWFVAPSPAMLDRDANVQQAGIGMGALRSLPPATSDEAWDEFIRAGQAEGTVMAELSPEMVGASRVAGADEAYEVLLVKRVLERHVVTDSALVRVHMDDGGAPVLQRQPLSPADLLRETGAASDPPAAATGTDRSRVVY